MSSTSGTPDWWMRLSSPGAGQPGTRDAVLCMQGNRLQAIKWRQWKAHLFQNDDFYSNWMPYNSPVVHNLGWDPREEHEIIFAHAWVLHPMAAAAVFMQSLAMEPPIKPGHPTRTPPPKPGELIPQEHLQLGPIVQFVTTLHHLDGQPADVRQHQPEHGLSHAHGA